MTEIPTHGSTDQPSSNLLPPGRYEFKVLTADPFVSTKGNPCVKACLEINGVKKYDYIVTADGIDWRWKQFLYAIGVRRKLKKNEKVFNVTVEELIGKTGLCDIIQDDDEDPENPKNRIRMYLPKEKKKAPMADVPAEPEGEPGDPIPKENVKPPKREKKPAAKPAEEPAPTEPQAPASSSDIDL